MFCSTWHFLQKQCCAEHLFPLGMFPLRPYGQDKCIVWGQTPVVRALALICDAFNALSLCRAWYCLTAASVLGKKSRYKDPLQKFLGWLLEGKSLDQEKVICLEKK